MTIPFLDALLPPTLARSTPIGPDQAAAGVFEALLAGLESGQAFHAPEQPLALLAEALAPTDKALPGAALPLTGKALPDRALPLTGKALPDRALPLTGKALPDNADAVSDKRSAVVASEQPPLEPNDKPLSSSLASEAPPVLVAPADVVALLPVAALASSSVAEPVPMPSGPTAIAAPSRPSSTQATLATVLSTPTPISPEARTTARGEQPAAQVGFAPPAATPTPALPPSAEHPAPRAPEPLKPTQPHPSSLTIVASAIQPSVQGAAPAPLKREPGTKLALVALAAAADPAPFTIAAAPVAVPLPPVGAAGDVAQIAAQAPTQAPVQAIALPDHRALVEALVRARAERDPGVSVALETREFGAVALRFETLNSVTGERGLQVALSSSDPGFERAVTSAAAAQAALADQSGRNPANRGDPLPTRPADPSGNSFGDAASGRGTASDAQAQQRSSAEEGWREPRHRSASDPLTRGDDHPSTPRPDRRRGSIFA